MGAAARGAWEAKVIRRRARFAGLSVGAWLDQQPLEEAVRLRAFYLVGSSVLERWRLVTSRKGPDDPALAACDHVEAVMSERGPVWIGLIARPPKQARRQRTRAV